jgi:hypothetical protein
MATFYPAPGAPSSFEGWTLVVAAAAHANVGQLAADLLVSTLRLSHAGTLASPHALPCCGNDAVGDVARGALTTALEAYCDGGSRTALLQQRAPAARGAQRALAADVAAWADRAGFGRVLVLAGLEAAHATQVGPDGAFRYAAPPAGGPAWPPASGAPTPQQLGWVALEGDTLGGVALRDARAPPWPLLAACAAKGAPALALLRFASEGDNAGDAAELAERCCELLALRRDGPWRAPAAWAAAFGKLAGADNDADDIF